MIPLAASSLKFWESFSEFGFILVIIGVVGEVSELAVKWVERRRGRSIPKKEIRWLLPVETLFFAVLVVGLSMEFLGSHNATRIADAENARLSEIGDKAKEAASQANQAAEKAKADRASIELQVERFRQTNLVLQTKALELQAQVSKLEARTQDRRIGPSTKRAMLDALANIPKGKVVVAAFQSDREAVAFGKQIADLLNEAGCKATFTPTVTMNATYTGLVFLVKDPAKRPKYADVVLSVFKASSIEADGWMYISDYDYDTLGIYVFSKPAPSAE